MTDIVIRLTPFTVFPLSCIVFLMLYTACYVSLKPSTAHQLVVSSPGAFAGSFSFTLEPIKSRGISVLQKSAANLVVQQPKPMLRGYIQTHPQQPFYFQTYPKQLFYESLLQGTSLTAEQAKTLAIRLANEKADALYHYQPFRDGRSARLVAGHWVWTDQQGYGQGDIQATVELAADGSTNNVDLQLLDNRAYSREF
jgi:hypothetical protein